MIGGGAPASRGAVQVGAPGLQAEAWGLGEAASTAGHPEPLQGSGWEDCSLVSILKEHSVLWETFSF